MDSKRKSYTPEFKLKVVLESMQRDTTQEEVCKKFGISSSMLHRWRKEFQTNAASVFQDKRDPVGVPLPTSDEKYGLQPHIRCANTPPKFFSRVKLQSVGGFCRIVSSRELPHCASPLKMVHRFLRKCKKQAARSEDWCGIARLRSRVVPPF